jgi:aspartate aminotransferase
MSGLSTTKNGQISDRGLEAPASPIRKLVPLAEAAKEKGVQVLHLNIGQPDIPTPDEMLAALREYRGPVLDYAPSGGFPEFLEALAVYYQRCGIPLGREDILVTTAGSEALIFALASITDPGDEIIVPEPLYANYLGFASMLGIGVKSIACAPEEGYRIPPPEELDRLYSDRCRAFILTNPNNPTGRITGASELEALGDWIRRRGLFLIGDEVYREFCYEKDPPPSVLNLKGCEQLTILVDSLSKRFSACGARIGCLATRNRDVLAAALKFAQARLSPPTIGQLMGIRAYRDVPASFYRDMVKSFKERRDILCERLGAIPDVTLRKPQGAFYLMPTLPVKDTDDFAAWLLTDFQWEGETVMVAPGAGFYRTEGLGRSEVRIAYVLETGKLERASRILAEGLKAYAGS